ncbi:MAG TPA: AmmeMemoRadiSam system radical SAM enzyme [Myxococcota bacterium]|nr:AmmeMemoRadiSam system radical SAM enzyme [Myxococcota bacterium]HRY93550.1 AmmeMemoRadiSam system radical SAM enzyme [Myxococcota bacterium]HSA22504.1 AmmeMemoRadiSam system radical SAM enzyme [Myxococcota bacterium]
MSTPPEARYWQPEDGGSVRCSLCPHACRIAPGARGRCGVRENRAGRLLALSYGRCVAAHLDPIEKKPLFHLLPGSRSLSVAAAGCNLRCQHCQNYTISQLPRDLASGQELPGEDLPPAEVVAAAVRAGAASISFTYTEPSVFWEWCQDIAALAVERGLRTVAVTNGFLSARPLEDLGARLSAANVDLKAFRDGFYRHTCGARLQPVLDTIQRLRALGVWVEVTTLLIPGLNDGDGELAELAAWLASVDRAMPWHVSAFHPDFELRGLPPTPPESLARARALGLEAGLRFVYSGNAWGDDGEHTRCPACQAMLVRRHGFRVLEDRLGARGACPDCGERIEGLWA